MTSSIPQTIDENSGRWIVRPRRALNHPIRPSTANAIGVVASANNAAAIATAISGSSEKKSRSFAARLVELIVALPPDGGAGNIQQPLDSDADYSRPGSRTTT